MSFVITESCRTSPLDCNGTIKMLKVKDMKNAIALMIPHEFPIYAYS